MLIQLPSGDWVDPARVKAVMLLKPPRSDGRHEIQMSLDEGTTLTWAFATPEEALVARDTCAVAVNVADDLD